eukprot:1209714-Karenia_brevis.AAC.1
MGWYNKRQYGYKHYPEQQKDGLVSAGCETPHWGCDCGESANWACRIACRSCGKPAPQRIVQSAVAAAVGKDDAEAAGGRRQPKKRQNAEVRPAEPAAPRGAWATSPGGLQMLSE